jgi:hypothetical protein
MMHDCEGIHRGRCSFSNNLTQLEGADAVLFSAQIFPGLGRCTAPFAHPLLRCNRTF